jgi:hypothetical protein
MKRVFVVAIVVLAAGVVFAQDINTDYDRSYRLSELQSFQIAKQERERADALAANPIVDKRIAEALRNQLVANGIPESPQPKFLVAYYGSLRGQTQIRAYGWGRPYWGGVTNIDLQHYDEGTLVVDFIDANSKALVWRGTITDTVEPNRSHDKLEKAIAKLVRKFEKDVQKQQKALASGK